MNATTPVPFRIRLPLGRRKPSPPGAPRPLPTIHSTLVPGGVMLVLMLIGLAAPAHAQASGPGTGNGFPPAHPSTTESGGESSTDSSSSERPPWRNLSGWEFFKAATSTQFSLRTAFHGSSAELTGQPFDAWQGYAIATAEVEIITERASIWAEMGYRGLDSMSDADTTGWTDLVAGLKIALIDQGPFLFSAYGGPRLPIGSQSVSDEFNQAQVGLAMSVSIADIFGINAGIDGAVQWNLPGEEELGFRGRLYGELAFAPASSIQARIGLIGGVTHREVGLEKFTAYFEGRVAFLFARIGVPFDFSEGANTEADLMLEAGVTFGF